jgi:hypothetical protein
VRPRSPLLPPRSSPPCSQAYHDHLSVRYSAASTFTTSITTGSLTSRRSKPSVRPLALYLPSDGQSSPTPSSLPALSYLARVPSPRARSCLLDGLHHDSSKAASSSEDTHSAKAKIVVARVLDLLDKDKDGVLTLSEFIEAGSEGLPDFKGFEELGHHYGESVKRGPPEADDEMRADRVSSAFSCCFPASSIEQTKSLSSEFSIIRVRSHFGLRGISLRLVRSSRHLSLPCASFLHHEERFHGTPETQTDEAYNHPVRDRLFLAPGLATESSR